MSITGLIIALGLLIDNAIIMVDEVRHRLHQGIAPPKAIADSVRRLAIPLFGSTATTVLAFSPIVLMIGPSGEFTGAMALCVILALASSYFLAMTVVPALTGFLDGVGRKPTRYHFWYEGFKNDRLSRWYAASLRYVTEHPAAGIALALALPVFGFIQGAQLPLQFFPPSGRDQFHVQVRLAPQSSLERTRETVLAMREDMLAHPAVEDVHWFAGTSAPRFYYNLLSGNEGSSNFAQAMVEATSPAVVQDTVRQLQRDLDARYPEAQTFVIQLEQGPPFDAPVEMKILGPDINTLRELGAELRRHLAQVPDVVHAMETLTDGRPKFELALNETEIREAGLSRVGIAAQINAALEGAEGGSVLEQTEELPVRVRMASRAREDLRLFESLPFLASGSGQASRAGPIEFDGPAYPQQAVPLESVGDLELVPELAGIFRINMERANIVRGYITAGVLPSTVVERVRNRLEETGFTLPHGYRLEFGGEEEERGRSVGRLMASVPLILVCMAATLVLAFNSFRMALLIASVGAAAVGLGLSALFVWGYPFGFMAIVGTMGLVGIAINDSIVVLAAIRADEDACRGDLDALQRVVMRSTRHVLSTTLTTTAGFLPLLLFGGPFWAPLAISIAGGVSGCTLLALYYIPAAYVLLTRKQRAQRNAHEARLDAAAAAT